jgi:hypothetical protein
VTQAVNVTVMMQQNKKMKAMYGLSYEHYWKDGVLGERAFALAL